MSLRERVASWLARPLIEERVKAIEAATSERVREAFASGALRAEEQRDLEQGYRRLSDANGKNPWRRDLQPLAQDQMQRLVYWLWESNPVAKWIIETTVDFILGEGVKVLSEVEDIQEAIDTFWYDPVNRLDRNIDRWGRELSLYGELCLPAAVNEFDGHVRLGYIDPLAIEEVVTDPDNALITTGVRIKSTVAGHRGELYKVIRQEISRASSYYGLMMPALAMERDNVTGEPYKGSCFLFRINNVTSARRGRSDLLPTIDWLDGYDAFLFDSMDAAGQFNSFVWDVTLEGANEENIRDFLTKNSRIKRGMIRAHNEKVKWAEVAPDLKAVDKDAYARLLLNHILASFSFPSHWYGHGEGVSFASSKEMGLVPVKRLTRRQKDMRDLITDLIRFQIHQKIRVGVLPETVVVGRVAADGSSEGTEKKTDAAFTVVMPELSMRDQAAIVAAANGLTAALQQVVLNGWLRPETAAKIMAASFSQLGMEINADEEFTPGAGPPPGATQDYASGNIERILAQLGRVGKGDGENVGQPKEPQPASRNGQEAA
jgi:hypothetical protein